MTAKLDYRWHLREVMAAKGMFSTTDLVAPLAQRGIHLSTSQVYRLVVSARSALGPRTGAPGWSVLAGRDACPGSRTSSWARS